MIERISFDQYIFDFENVFGSNINEVVTDYTVHDLFNVRQGALIRRQITIFSNDIFMDKITFVAS